MNTEALTARDVDRAAAILRAGGLVGIPTVSSPAVTTSGTMGLRRKTMVRGPGQ